MNYDHPSLKSLVDPGVKLYEIGRCAAFNRNDIIAINHQPVKPARVDQNNRRDLEQVNRR